MREFYRLPEIKVETNDAPVEAVELVNNALAELRQKFPELIKETWLSYMRDQRKYGWTKVVDLAIEDLKNAPVWNMKPRSEVHRALKHFCETELGEALVKCMPRERLRVVGPFSGINFELDDHGWKLQLRPLSHRYTAVGGVYHSPHWPTTNLPDGLKYVAFSKHAILQMCDRIVPAWDRSYVGLNHIFGFLYECTYFEPVTLPNGQIGFSFWNSCKRVGHEFWEKVKGLVSAKEEERGHAYYRVGYCPAVIDKDTLIAKTFLVPGFFNTPERTVLQKKSKNPTKIATIEMAADEGINVIRAIEDPKAWSAIEWFHNHGIDQISRIEFEVFKPGLAHRIESDIQPIDVERSTIEDDCREEAC